MAVNLNMRGAESCLLHRCRDAAKLYAHQYVWIAHASPRHETSGRAEDTSRYAYEFQRCANDQR
jgi:hypothetical protein